VTMTNDTGSLTHLRAAGVSLVLDTRGGALPSVIWWGPDLGDLSVAAMAELARASLSPVGDSVIDAPDRVSLLATPAEGWVGTPGLLGSRAGADFSTLFTLVEEREIPADGVVAAGRWVRAVDEVAELALELDIELLGSGLLRLRASLTNTAADASFDLGGLNLALPVPAVADEVFDLTGRHARERIPQRGPFRVGSTIRESRKGKPGLDASYLLAAGETGFGFTSGQVWGVHVGWSGNQVAYAELAYNGQRHLGGGELLLPGEIRLLPGETYTSPWLFASYGAGFNELAGRFHGYLRSRPEHPRSARPVVLNTWEAVYFEQSLERLTELAELGAAVGAERFVLDDGWFRHRRNDDAGLGDWYVDEGVWPAGLGPLITKVRELGMEFGLWVEPEMINLDSDLAREHPEWIFRAGGRRGMPSRNQYVLDLGHQGAYDYIAGRLHDLLDSYDISYLKWDHNRMVVEAGHGKYGAPGVHAHTAALYRLLDELRERHPGLEIESCAGGGGRIDLGIIQHTDRVWASDCIDALERQQIQRYTQLLLPPELIGSHVGEHQAHTTQRMLHLDFRAATAFWGHMGIEWDLTKATPADRARLAQWIAAHKAHRDLLHSGVMVVGDHPDPAIWINGVVAPDRREAIFGLTTVARSITWPPGRVRLPGLDPARVYRLAPLAPADRYPEAGRVPGWWDEGVSLTGHVISTVGVQIPAMYPEYVHLVRATAEPEVS
jgi:alpha-galactosidase